MRIPIQSNDTQKDHLAHTARRSTATGRAGLGSMAVALVLAFALGIGASEPSFAQGTDAQRRAAIASAMDQAGGYGKVISVKPQTQADGSPGFRVRILTDGHVRTFDVPANTRQ
jgi:hypothetical protein